MLVAVTLQVLRPRSEAKLSGMAVPRDAERCEVILIALLPKLVAVNVPLLHLPTVMSELVSVRPVPSIRLARATVWAAVLAAVEPLESARTPARAAESVA